MRGVGGRLRLTLRASPRGRSWFLRVRGSDLYYIVVSLMSFVITFTTAYPHVHNLEMTPQTSMRMKAAWARHGFSTDSLYCSATLSLTTSFDNGRCMLGIYASILEHDGTFGMFKS